MAPVVYLPLATAVCSLSVGVTVLPASVDNWLVLLPLTVIVPAVPLDTHPADTLGVTLFVADAVAVIRPPLLTLILGLAVTDVAGVEAVPLGTVTGLYACPVGAVVVPDDETVSASIMVCVPCSSDRCT